MTSCDLKQLTTSMGKMAMEATAIKRLENDIPGYIELHITKQSMPIAFFNPFTGYIYLSEKFAKMDRQVQDKFVDRILHHVENDEYYNSDYDTIYDI